MFTGIITDVGEIKRLEKMGDLRAVIETEYRTDLISDGASICCSGVCLTLVDKGQNWFAVDVSKETTDTTTIGRWTVGTSVNLERSLQLSDELGGHIVSGHIDGIVELRSIEKEGASRRISLEVPSNLAKFIALPFSAPPRLAPNFPSAERTLHGHFPNKYKQYFKMNGHDTACAFISETIMDMQCCVHLKIHKHTINFEVFKYMDIH